MILLQRVLLGV